jgi:hypothetical protein
MVVVERLMRARGVVQVGNQTPIESSREKSGTVGIDQAVVRGGRAMFQCRLGRSASMDVRRSRLPRDASWLRTATGSATECADVDSFWEVYHRVGLAASGVSREHGHRCAWQPARHRTACVPAGIRTSVGLYRWPSGGLTGVPLADGCLTPAGDSNTDAARGSEQA